MGPPTPLQLISTYCAPIGYKDVTYTSVGVAQSVYNDILQARARWLDYKRVNSLKTHSYDFSALEILTSITLSFSTDEINIGNNGGIQIDHLQLRAMMRHLHYLMLVQTSNKLAIANQKQTFRIVYIGHAARS